MALGQKNVNYATEMLREWAPLDLLSKLPTKTQVGLFYQEIKLTCVDALPEFLALGTNVGIVYWYDRKKKEMQRLRCENPNIPITSLKILSTVDYMVACGNKLGNISIFQIPKSHPESLPENLKPKNKQVERYTVTELHKSPISSMEWSKNGMKLFSGDKNGCVVLTEIDFYMHICKSVEILNEAYEVVQLSYNQQRLLISTTYRTIVCQKLDKWKICQVGKKDRKVLGQFGGLIFQHSYKLSDTYFYCSRPGLRIWISDIEGNVLKTLIFKELLIKESPKISLLNPISQKLRTMKLQKEPGFGTLLPFNDRLLVTYNNDIVYLLDPEEMTILATINHLRGILDIATHKDELFILEEERSLIRISYQPEHVNVENSFSAVSNALRPLTSSIKGLTMKLQSASVISAIPPILENTFSNNVSVHTDENMVMNAEEATETPKNIHTFNSDIQRSFEDIGRQDFSDTILFKKTRHHKKRLAMDTSVSSLSSNSSDEKESNCIRPTIMNLSCVGILPDLRSPESIKYDIEYKEKILADVLSLDKVKIIEEIKDCMPQVHSESDCDITSENFNDKTDNDKFTEREQSVEKLSIHQPSFETPACVNIPNEWKLNNIQIKLRNDSSNSLSDWEII